MDDRWGSIGETGDILIIIAVIRIMVAIVPLRRAADPVASKWFPHYGYARNKRGYRVCRRCGRDRGVASSPRGALARAAAPRRQAACLAGGSSERGPGTLFEK